MMGLHNMSMIIFISRAAYEISPEHYRTLHFDMARGAFDPICSDLLDTRGTANAHRRVPILVSMV